MNIEFDDGIQFGLGAFETIEIRNDEPVLLEWHLERLNKSLDFLKIKKHITGDNVISWLKNNMPSYDKTENKQDNTKTPGKLALKILVTEKNTVFDFRHNPYTTEQKDKGFRLDYSPIIRNETSPLIYHKTINYGDNILEMRRIKSTDTDEVVFLNSKGEICEGSRTNIFFVREKEIITPEIKSGLLPGVVRRLVIEKCGAKEVQIFPKDVEAMEECFVTNSLMGIMPVTKLGDVSFSIGEVSKNCMKTYNELI